MLTDDTQPGFPLLPSYTDCRWQPAIIRPKRSKLADLLSLPLAKHSQILCYIESGAEVAIIRDVRYKTFIATRIDAYVGWLDSWHIDPTSLKTDKLTPPKQENLPDWLDDSEETVPAELLTSQMDSVTEVAPRDDKMPKKEDISRVIKYLKSLSGAFARRS